MLPACWRLLVCLFVGWFVCLIVGAEDILSTRHINSHHQAHPQAEMGEVCLGMQWKMGAIVGLMMSWEIHSGQVAWKAASNWQWK